MNLSIDEALDVWRNHRKHPRSKVSAAYDVLRDHLTRRHRRKFPEQQDRTDDLVQQILMRVMNAPPPVPSPRSPAVQAAGYLNTAVKRMAVDIYRRAPKRLGVPISDPEVEAKVDVGSEVGMGVVGERAQAEDAAFDAWLDGHVAARNDRRRGVGDNMRQGLELLRGHKAGEVEPPPSANALRVAARHREWLVEQLWCEIDASSVHAAVYVSRWGDVPRRGPSSESPIGQRMSRLITCLDATRDGRISEGDTSLSCARADVWRLILQARYCTYDVPGSPVSDSVPPSRHSSERT